MHDNDSETMLETPLMYHVPTARCSLLVSLILAVLAGYRVVLAIFVIPQAPILLSLSQLIATVIAYPLMVLGSAILFGIRRVTPGEVDTLGHRI